MRVRMLGYMLPSLRSLTAVLWANEAKVDRLHERVARMCITVLGIETVSIDYGSSMAFICSSRSGQAHAYACYGSGSIQVSKHSWLYNYHATDIHERDRLDRKPCFVA